VKVLHDTISDRLFPKDAIHHRFRTSVLPSKVSWEATSAGIDEGKIPGFVLAACCDPRPTEKLPRDVLLRVESHMLSRVESIHEREQEDARICDEKCEFHDGNLRV